MFALITTLVVGMIGGASISLSFNSSTDVSGNLAYSNPNSVVLTKLADLVQQSPYFLIASGGHQYFLDFGSSGIYFVDDDRGERNLGMVLVFFSFATGVSMPCGQPQRPIAKEIDVILPVTPSGHDLKRPVVHRYDTPFVYLCPKFALPSSDSTMFRFHVQVNSSGRWELKYHADFGPYGSSNGTESFKSEGLQTLNVVLFGDIYAGIGLCASAGNSSASPFPIALSIQSIGEKELRNQSTVDNHTVKLCTFREVPFNLGPPPPP